MIQIAAAPPVCPDLRRRFSLPWFPLDYRRHVRLRGAECHHLYHRYLFCHHHSPLSFARLFSVLVAGYIELGRTTSHLLVLPTNGCVTYVTISPFFALPFWPFRRPGSLRRSSL